MPAKERLLGAHFVGVPSGCFFSRGESVVYIDQASMGATATGVPPGAYQGEFLGVEPTPPNVEKGYGPGFKWVWKITTGPLAGSLATRITGDKPSPKNACGQIMTALGVCPSIAFSP